MLASIEVVISFMPKSVREVVEPSDGLIGTSSLSHNANMEWRLSLQVMELAGPAVKKSFE